MHKVIYRGILATLIAMVVLASVGAESVRCSGVDCDIPINEEAEHCNEWYIDEWGNPLFCTNEEGNMDNVAMWLCEEASCDDACEDYGNGGGHPYYVGPTPEECMGVSVADGESSCQLIDLRVADDGGVPEVVWAIAEKTCYCGFKDGEGGWEPNSTRTPRTTVIDPITAAINRWLRSFTTKRIGG